MASNYDVIADAIKDRFADKGTVVEVLYWGNKRYENNRNVDMFLARAPIDSEHAFEFVEMFKMPFLSTDSRYSIRQVESARMENNRDHTNGYFSFAFDVEKLCM